MFFVWCCSETGLYGGARALRRRADGAAGAISNTGNTAVIAVSVLFAVPPGPMGLTVVRLGDRAATYGLGPRKMSEGYCYVLPYTRWVNLGFFKGAELADPAGLLEGTGAMLRHVKVRSLDAAEGQALRDLIEVALAARTTALGR